MGNKVMLLGKKITHPIWVYNHFCYTVFEEYQFFILINSAIPY
jgi:hypothetical protein